TAVTKDVEAALALAASHREAGRRPDAEAALQRAEARTGAIAPQSLRDKVRQARADANTIGELEDIRVRHNQVYKGDGVFDPAGADRQYADAFRHYGIDPERMQADEVANRMRGSAVRDGLLAGLDNWMRVRPQKDRPVLRAVADAADDNAWRKSLR